MVKNILFIGVLNIILVSCFKKPNEYQEDMGKQIVVNQPNNIQNWAGIYRGELPCADCSGIETEIILNVDGTYYYKEHYLDTQIHNEYSGDIRWESGRDIICLDVDGEEIYFKVYKTYISYLDQEGKEVEGTMKDKYNLLKYK